MAQVTSGTANRGSKLGAGIKEERDAISRMSRLSGAHWLAVCLSLLLTTGAWYFSSMQLKNQTEARFNRYSEQVMRLVEERMMHYEDTLSSAVATIHTMGGDMSHAEWVEFASALEIETKYPGINGIGVIYRVERADLDAFIEAQRVTRPDFDIHPGHNNPELYPITYIEPAEANMAAVGLDMAHETNRHEATLKARDTGKPQITGPIVLVQDAQKTPGFLFYMPVYETRKPADLNTRRQEFVGMVYAPFVFKKLIEGILGQENRLVEFAIRDESSLLYTEELSDGLSYEPEYRKTLTGTFYGRSWTFEFWDTPEFQAATHSNEPKMILFGGLIIDGMLFTLFVLLANSNTRALSFADRMAEEAEIRAESLERSNEDLERFAYVASHDLKTPLRGIGFLTECIRDDVKSAKVEISGTNLNENLMMLDDQVRHMDDLISGILAYSSVRSESAEPELVETSKLIYSIASCSGLKPEQIRILGENVTFTTDSTRLQQVLQNLIGNAYKYHHTPSELIVTVDIQDRGNALQFSVTDNGDGIDPRYHQKIFEMFQTLKARDAATGTGIGLAIVKKIVNHYGGEIRLQSRLGDGCTFIFDWPKSLDAPLNSQVAA